MAAARQGLARRPPVLPRGRARGGRLLPQALELRQDRALHPRRELHRLVLVEDLRQRRRHHLGDPADRLPVHRRRHARVRAPRLPARRRVQLVRVLAHPHQVPLRARRPPRHVPRGQGAPGRPGGRVGGRRRGPRQGPRLQDAARPRRHGPRVVGGGDGDRRRRLRAHDQAVRARPDRRLLRHPRHVDDLLRRGSALPRAHRRHHALLLRLVRGPAPGQPAGVRRPDRRSRGRGLVQQPVPDHVGHEPAADAHPRRALHGRGPLPRPEGRRRLPGLRGQHEVRGRLAARPARHGRRPGSGDGPRHPQGVLRRQARAHVPGLHDALHGLPVPGGDQRGRRGRPRRHRPEDPGARQVPDGRQDARGHHRAHREQPVPAPGHRGRRHGQGPGRHAGRPFRRGGGPATGTSTWRA